MWRLDWRRDCVARLWLNIVTATSIIHQRASGDVSKMAQWEVSRDEILAELQWRGTVDGITDSKGVTRA